MKFSTCFLLFVVLLMFAVFPQTATSNNIQVSTPVLTGQNTGSHFTQVQFTVTWDNSWRDVVNWDAAWVFVKYKGNDGVWKHATLSATGSDHTAPSGSTITPSSDGKGVFIYRSTNGSGSNSFTNAKLHWNYGTDGVGDNDLVTVKVFAIEMVYAPTAEFAAGDGTSGGNQFTLTTINTSNATTAPSGSGSLGGQAGGYPTGATVPTDAAYPNGYAAFYCMKYETSQGQYADFLNTLTSTQASNDFPNSNGNKRHTISVSGGVYASSRPDRACNDIGQTLSWAYADWAALRPMTELEYEKSCRGNQTPVAGEYAWGTTNITAADAISGTEDGTETVTTSGANCCYNDRLFSGGDGGDGPLRCGIFAKGSTTREQAGASYYGIMDLSGNVYENTVGLTDAGKGYTGLPGDGALDASGYANVSNWPSFARSKGGSFNCTGGNIANLQVSDRDIAETGGAGGSSAGFRCVRTAP